jgi:IclR family KDG regulon transcriptional repressor
LGRAMNKKSRSNTIPRDSSEKITTAQSTRRAADILKCIGNGVNSVTGIAACCNLHKSTVHRLLKAMVESDLVIQNPVNHRYFLGYLFIKLSLTPSMIYRYLVDCAGEPMQHLSNLTGETIDLRIKLGLRNIGLDLVQSKNDLIFVGDTLRNRPVTVGVDGRVLLSQLDDEELSLVSPHILSDTVTKRKKADMDNLMDDINRIRRQGYAFSSNELIMGVSCISAPVKNNLIPAVISIVGPEIRIRPRVKDFSKELLVCAARISKCISNYQKKFT